MKKILSMLVLAALLLATLGISASAAAFYDYGELNARVTVKKSNAVVIDGKISAGEYEKLGFQYSEWYVAENASDYFAEAEEMAKTVEWYFSWDGKYLNIAAKWNAGSGANQTFAGGDYYGDYAFADTEDFVYADDFLGYGPGMNVVSAEMSPEDDQWTRTFVAISENTTTGEKMIGMYSGQNGQNMDYKPAWDDFDFTYEGTWVTAEYRIPIIELSETFKENQGGQMFKGSIVLQAGVAGQFTTDPETGEAVEINAANYGWGVRVGQMGYCSDSGNTEKTWATFRLVDDLVPGGDVTPPTTNGEVTPPTTNGEVTPPTTNGEVTPPTTNGEVTPPTTNGEVTPPTTNGDNTPVAPPTGDIMVVAAVVSAISACGVMIAKKRK